MIRWRKSSWKRQVHQPEASIHNSLIPRDFNSKSFGSQAASDERHQVNTQ
jgi:hypothetical protein